MAIDLRIEGHGIWQLVKREIQDHLVHRSNGPIDGKPKTLEAYREEVGFIAGLNWVLQAATEVVAKIGTEKD